MSPSDRRRPAPAGAAEILDLLAGQPGVTPALRGAWREAVRRFGHRPEVTGIDVGFEVKGGKETGRLAVRIHVEEKFRTGALTARQRFPRTLGKARVPVDVIQSNFRTHEAVLVAEAARRERLDPIMPGISIGHVRGRPGTLGAFVADAAGRRCLLTAAHVLLDDPTAAYGDAVLQPGRLHGGGARDAVATIWKVNRDTDSGVAPLTGARGVELGQRGTGVVLAAARLPRVGDVLEKSGQRTGVTQGRVQGIGSHAGRPASFFLVPVAGGTPQLSDAGDSGAVWYDPATAEAVGVHVRGPLQFNPDHEYAVATPVVAALRILGVTLDAGA